MYLEILVGIFKGAGWEGVKLLWRYIRKKEDVIYSGLPTIYATDIRHFCGPSYKDGQPVGAPAQGDTAVVNGVIDITRANTEGRIEITLQRLGSRENTSELLLHDPGKAGRYLRFRFRAKCIGGSRTLRAEAIEPGLPSRPRWNQLASRTCRVESPSWHSFELGFLIKNQTRGALLRILDEEASAAGSVQIEKLQVTEVAA
jgi:hypothetical protein